MRSEFHKRLRPVRLDDPESERRVFSPRRLIQPIRDPCGTTRKESVRLGSFHHRSYSLITRDVLQFSLQICRRHAAKTMWLQRGLRRTGRQAHCGIGSLYRISWDRTLEIGGPNAWALDACLAAAVISRRDTTHLVSLTT